MRLGSIEFDDMKGVATNGLRIFLGGDDHTALPLTLGTVIEGAKIGFGNQFTVDVEIIAFHLDGIARQTNYPFDVVDAGILGKAKDHDVSRLHRIALGQLRMNQRQAQAPGKFIYQQKIADADGGQHGTRGYLKGLKKKGANQKHHQQYRKETTGIVDKHGHTLVDSTAAT